ncbi:hypothetical protein MCP_1227 [Methanocella paludicola SANAE]|uniref:Uncharacterized protein n=1 Tax=Methanocella paludicola (strain DSM 17711 / JCM 13418 / NBRC 101707 / SANAE) TaxID=304371 RepID=D1YXX7_METPS|nr:hypothetical protein [Methanocella paludicola]BAI61299.1 hypothetical protein MCP_1227 [Methanocella paludicola SANAE]
MKEEIHENVSVGEIVDFVLPFSRYSMEAIVLVRNNDQLIPILLDDRQRGYVKDKCHVGKKVAIGYYNGQWHLGIPQQGQCMIEPVYEISANDAPFDDDAIYIRNVEKDFSEDVDEILNNIGLSHLKVAKK